MKRNNEYYTLLQDLERTPLELEETVQRAKARVKRSRLRWLALPTAVAAVFAAFVVMVNTSVSFAYALADVPVLGDLAALVESSRYMADIRSAVKNHHAQVIGQRQTADGLTVTVEYAIVDPWQINLFVRTENVDESLSYTELELLSPESDDIFSFREDENGWLRRYVLGFPDGNIPQDLSLQFIAWPTEQVDGDGGEKPIAFDFNVVIEEKSISPVQTVKIGQLFTAGEQQIWLDRLEITHAQTWLVMDGVEENSAWLSAIQAWLQDENGNYVAPTFTRSTDQSGEYIISLGKNVWNSDSDLLQLSIERTWWEPKNTTEVIIDTTNKTATGLPDWLVLEDIYLQENASQQHYPGRPVYQRDATVLCFSCPAEMLERVEEIGANYYYLSPFTTSVHSYSQNDSTVVHFEIHCYENNGRYLNSEYTYDGTTITLKIGSRIFWENTDHSLISIPIQ